MLFPATAVMQNPNLLHYGEVPVPHGQVASTGHLPGPCSQNDQEISLLSKTSRQLGGWQFVGLGQGQHRPDTKLATKPV